METRFINASLFTEDGFVRGTLSVRDGFIVSDSDGAEVDCEGGYLLPGLLDIHIHGAAGVEFCDSNSLSRMAEHLITCGVTGFCPTSVSRPEEELLAGYEAFHDYEQIAHPGLSQTLGINMEGPFLSEERRGAHKKKYLCEPSMELFLKLFHASGERIAVVSVAPELHGALEFAEAAHDFCAVSAAHSAASYERAELFYQSGATLLTHLYNGMPPLCSREPGLIAAAHDKAQYVTLICDGYHISPPAIRAAFHLFEGRVVLISDGMAALGMPDGDYTLGELAVNVTDRRATLRDGTLAGGATDLLRCVQNAVRFGIPLWEAVAAATINPAKAIGRFEKIGSLEIGKAADLVLLKPDLTLSRVYLAGERVV